MHWLWVHEVFQVQHLGPSHRHGMLGLHPQGQVYLHNARSALLTHGQLLGIPNRRGHLCGGGLDAPKSRWFGRVSWGWKESASEHVRCVALGSSSQADALLGRGDVF